MPRRRPSSQRPARGDQVAADAGYLFGRSLAESLFYVFAVKMSAVFMLVSSTIGRRTGFLPRWFIVVGMLAAVAMLLSVGFFEPLALIFPAWVAVVSLLILRAHPDSWAAGLSHAATRPQAGRRAPSA